MNDNKSSDPSRCSINNNELIPEISGNSILTSYGNINSKLKKYVFSDTVNTEVLKNIHGDSSGVRGAASLGR